MKSIFLICALSSFFLFQANADDKAIKQNTVKEEAFKLNEMCPVSGKKANPECTFEYEDVTYAFFDGECRKKFSDARDNSLYQKVGGKAALDAAVELFYTKVLADERVKEFFEDVNMKKQRNKQKEFLASALGGPIPWIGKDMRKVHENLDLKESDFAAIAEHLQATLNELKVENKITAEIMAVVASTKESVLNLPKHHSKEKEAEETKSKE